MLFFGTLVLASMGYGFVSLLNGFITPFTHPVIKNIGEKINETAEKTAVAMKYEADEGILQKQYNFNFLETFPKIFELEDYGQDAYAGIIFHLTERENDRLMELLAPLAYFEQYGDIVPALATVKEAQRRMMIQPVLTFLDRIPDVRRTVVA